MSTVFHVALPRRDLKSETCKEHHNGIAIATSLRSIASLTAAGRGYCHALLDNNKLKGNPFGLPFNLVLVGVARLELTASCPPDKRATNCAIPRKDLYFFLAKLF